MLLPCPQSQSFSQSYGSDLPTSLTYFIPSTRGFSPWGPDAVMSTIESETIHAPWDFQGPTKALQTPQDVRCFANQTRLIASQTDCKGQWLSSRKENSTWGSGRRLPVCFCCQHRSTTRRRNISLHPFRCACVFHPKETKTQLSYSLRPSLRIG